MCTVADSDRANIKCSRMHTHAQKYVEAHDVATLSATKRKHNIFALLNIEAHMQIVK